MKTKICNKCKKRKPIKEFGYWKGSKDGLQYKCKQCINEYGKEHYNANAEEIKQKVLKWQADNKEKCDKYNKKWRKTNPKKYKESQTKAIHKIRQTPKGITNNRMSSAIHKALKTGKAGRHWESLVPYTLQKLMDHLESLFLPGMSWLNMGKWHIDHIIPKAHFRYSTMEDSQFKACWALENLQPLWREDNLKKGAKL